MGTCSKYVGCRIRWKPFLKDELEAKMKIVKINSISELKFFYARSDTYQSGFPGVCAVTQMPWLTMVVKNKEEKYKKGKVGGKARCPSSLGREEGIGDGGG